MAAGGGLWLRWAGSGGGGGEAATLCIQAAALGPSAAALGIRLRVGGEAERQPERDLLRERGHLELARLGECSHSVKGNVCG